MPTNGGIPTKRDLCKLVRKLLRGPVHSYLSEVSSERSAGIVINPNMSMPLGWTSSLVSDTTFAVGNGIALKPQRDPAEILDLFSLATLFRGRAESMVAFG